MRWDICCQPNFTTPTLPKIRCGKHSKKGATEADVRLITPKYTVQRQFGWQSGEHEYAHVQVPSGSLTLSSLSCPCPSER